MTTLHYSALLAVMVLFSATVGFGLGSHHVGVAAIIVLTIAAMLALHAAYLVSVFMVHG